MISLSLRGHGQLNEKRYAILFRIIRLPYFYFVFGLQIATSSLLRSTRVIMLAQQKMFNSNQKSCEVSRYSLKKEIEGLQSFDLSSFAESKNQSKNRFISDGSGDRHEPLQLQFPVINAPTYDEELEDAEYNIRYLDLENHKLPNTAVVRKNAIRQKQKGFEDEDEYESGITARNQYTNGSTGLQYETKIQQLGRDLEKAKRQNQRDKKEKELLYQKVQLLEEQQTKISEGYKEKIKELKDHIKTIKEREIRFSRQNEELHKKIETEKFKESSVRPITQSGSIFMSGSYIEDMSSFCPELLSPQQTVALLGKLLKKVSKSRKMIKELTDDQSVKLILNKIEKK